MTQPQRPMELFLTQTKLILSHLHNNTSTYKTIRVVMGDKTCDLDSAVCTLAQGLFEYIIAAQREPTVVVIPVMNITESEFRLKTEVIFWLKLHDIPQNLLTFRDHIDLHDTQNRGNKKLELILLDHHTLSDEDISLISSVVRIIDHRQQNVSWPWHNVSINIEIVGSCATLVARNILLHKSSMMDNQLSSLLRGPILVDTCNMLEKIRQTSVDTHILHSLERRGGLTTDRTEIFNRIMEVKRDINGLMPEDLLIKDIRVISDIPIVVLPLLVDNFLRHFEEAKDAIEIFSFDRNYTVIVLLGVEAKSNNVFRDIAVFYRLSDNNLGCYILDALCFSREPNLYLRLITRIRKPRYYFFLYKQENLEVTRKKILPIVQKAKLMYHREE